MNFRETECVNMKLIRMTQNVMKSWATVNTAMNLRVP
jgi:hypothetical protein